MLLLHPFLHELRLVRLNLFINLSIINMGDHLKIITETYVSKQIYLFLEPDEVFPCQTEICQWQSMFATSLFNTNVVVIFFIVWGGGGATFPPL